MLGKKKRGLLFKIEKHAFNPGTRIWARVEPLIEEIIKNGSKKEKVEVVEYAKEFKNIRQVLNFTYFSRNICFVLAYISLFSVLLGNVFFIGKLVKVAGFISGLAGTVLLLVILTILEKFMNLYVNDLLIISTHIISIYHKYRLVKVKRKVRRAREK